jgi:hypothetical protein
MATQTITAEEYQQILAERERIQKAIDDAGSEFMFQTWRAMLRTLNKRYDTATKLNIKLEDRQTNEKIKAKREKFQATKKGD